MKTKKTNSQDNSKKQLDHIHPSTIVRGDQFAINLQKFIDSEFYKKFTKTIYSRTCSISQQKVSYRVLSHWDTQGLIECERDSDKGWRKFNLIEALWVQIILELRKFGLPIAAICAAKTYFFEKCHNPEAIPYLEFYLAAAMALNKPVYVVVFSNGVCELFDYMEYKTALSIQLLGMHLLLNLNDLLKKLSIQRGSDPCYPLEREMGKEFCKVMDILHSSKFDAATIRKKDNIIDRVKLTAATPITKMLHETLNEEDNQDIVVKKRNGQVIHVSKTSIEKI